MRKIILSLCFAIITLHLLQAQSDEIPTLRANSETVRIIINGSVSEESIPFSNERSDTLQIPINLNPLDFAFYTDTDSIKTGIPVNSKLTFQIQKTGMKPLVIIFCNGIETNKITFDTTTKNNNLRFAYETGENNPYLEKLKAEYPIDSIASAGKTDLEKVRLVATWVHGLWKHDGYNTPKQNDALSILSEVKEGSRFRCVEYGIVTTACLNAIGFPSRTLSLKTKGVETTPTGAGHVVMEAFLKDINKWVMVDPQWNAIACLDNIPLNAVELQEAITENKHIQLLTNEDGFEDSQYKAWIYPYLYYFNCKFDNRENISKENMLTIDGKSEIMLVPIDAKKPTIFQIQYPIDYCLYTNSLSDFYREP